MNIVLVNTAHVVDSKGGAEKVLCDMANALTARGHEVTVACCENRQGTTGFPLDPAVRFINAGACPAPWTLHKKIRKLRSLSFSHNTRQRKRALLEAEFLGVKLRSALDDITPDIFVCFQLNSALAIKKAYGTSVPIITMLHCNPVIFPILDVLASEVSQLGLIQVLLPIYADYVRQKIPSANVICIPNTVPQYGVHADRTAKRIIHVGRVVPEKRQHLVIEAFSLIRNRFPDWEVEFWGDLQAKPEYTRRLKDRIAQLNLQDCVHLCGTSNNIPEKLLASSIFVFPSENFEGFPLALTEAMAMGMAVVGTREAAAVEALVHDTASGLLVESNAEDLARGLDKLMQSSKLRETLGNAAQKEMTDYAPKAIWDLWDDLIQKTVLSFKNS